MEWIVSDGDDGARLDKFLRDKLPTVALGTIQKLLRKKEVTVNGEPADRSARLAEGDRVDAPVQTGLPVTPAKKILFDVIHEDEDVIVLEKPAGQVAHPGPGHRTDTLLNGLFARWGEELARIGAKRTYGLVHRLDAGTSGLMVVAKNIPAYEHLVSEFSARRVRKAYIALVVGNPPAEGVIDEVIGELTRGDRRRMIAGSGARRKRARTEYEVVELVRNFALIEARPRTGRMHQIRVHLARHGFPIVGDPDYGLPRVNRQAQERLGLSRPFLHAARLAFTHPTLGETLSFESPLPEDLTAALDILRRWRKERR